MTAVQWSLRLARSALAATAAFVGRTHHAAAPDSEGGRRLQLPGVVRNASISFKLQAALGVIAALTVVATVVSFNSYGVIGGTMRKIEVDSVPAFTHVLALAKHASELSAISGRIASAENTDGLEAAKMLLGKARRASQASLLGLSRAGVEARQIEQLRSEIGELIEGAEQLVKVTTEKFDIHRLLARLHDDAVTAHRALMEHSAPIADDAHFNLVMEMRRIAATMETGKPAARGIGESELEVLDGIVELRAESNLILSLLTEISLAATAQQMPPLRDSLLASETRALKALGKLERLEQSSALRWGVARLLALGEPGSGIPFERDRELKSNAQAWDLLSLNSSRSAVLTLDIEVMAQQARDDMNASIMAASNAISSSKLKLVAISIISVLVVALGWIFIRQSIVHRLSRLHDAIAGVAAGNFAIAVPKSGHDELANMGQAVETFKANAIERQRLERQAEQERERAEDTRRRAAAEEEASNAERSRAIETVAEALSAFADNDLTHKIASDMPPAYRQLEADFNRMSDQVRAIVVRIARSTGAVEDATREIGTGIVDLSVRSEQQASALEETAASLEELSETVRQNAENAQSASDAAVAARELAIGGGGIAGKAVTAMANIEESSRRIREIVGLIEEIAFQTNILALNAAVEAARAGDAGRGFAVVANEVRALAQRSGKSLKDIKDLIHRSDANVKDGVGLVQQASGALNEITNSTRRVADFVSEIASASQEQAIGIEQVNKAVTKMDEMTQRNAGLVEETNAALTTAQSQVNRLREVVASFRTDAEMAARPVGGTAEATTPASSPPPAAVGKSPPVAAPTTKAAGKADGSSDADNPVHRQQKLLSRKLATRRAAPMTQGNVAVADDADWSEF